MKHTIITLMMLIMPISAVEIEVEMVNKNDVQQESFANYFGDFGHIKDRVEQRRQKIAKEFLNGKISEKQMHEKRIVLANELKQFSNINAAVSDFEMLKQLKRRADVIYYAQECGLIDDNEISELTDELCKKFSSNKHKISAKLKGIKKSKDVYSKKRKKAGKLEKKHDFKLCNVSDGQLNGYINDLAETEKIILKIKKQIDSEK